MLPLARDIGSLLVGALLVVVATGLLGTLVALRMDEEAFTGLGIGLVVAGYYAGLTWGARALPRLVAAFGHIRVFAASAALISAVTVGLPLFPAAPTWVALRVGAGFGMAGVYMVIETWLNARTTIGNRGATLALYMLVSQLGLALGQLLVPLYPVDLAEPFAVAAAFYALGLIPIALTRTPQPVVPAGSRFGLRQLLREAPLGLLGCAASGYVLSSLVGLGPLFVTGVGGDAELAAHFMALLVTGGMLSQWPLGRLSDRVGRSPVLIGTSLALCAAAVLTANLGAEPEALLLVVGAGVGAFGYVLYPLSLAQANDRIATDVMVAAGATMLLAFGLGAVVGPLVGAGLLVWLGPGGFFYGVAAVALALALGGYVVRRRRPPPPGLERERFLPLPLPQSAPAGRLDPRSSTLEHDLVPEPPARVPSEDPNAADES